MPTDPRIARSFVFYRRDHRPDRLLPLKMILFGVGAVLALAGMITERDLLIAAAVLVLVAGFLLRFAPDRSDEDEGETGS